MTDPTSSAALFFFQSPYISKSKLLKPLSWSKMCSEITFEFIKVVVNCG